MLQLLTFASCFLRSSGKRAMLAALDNIREQNPPDEFNKCIDLFSLYVGNVCYALCV
jgi:hypothetical protein